MGEGRAGEAGLGGEAAARRRAQDLHPVSITRFPFFRTQTLESLSVDNVKNGFLSNPDPGENIVSGNLVMETGCNLRMYHNIIYHNIDNMI